MASLNIDVTSQNYLKLLKGNLCIDLIVFLRHLNSCRVNLDSLDCFTGHNGLTNPVNSAALDCQELWKRRGWI